MALRLWWKRSTLQSWVAQSIGLVPLGIINHTTIPTVSQITRKVQQYYNINNKYGWYKLLWQKKQSTMHAMTALGIINHITFPAVSQITCKVQQYYNINNKYGWYKLLWQKKKYNARNYSTWNYQPIHHPKCVTEYLQSTTISKILVKPFP